MINALNIHSLIPYDAIEYDHYLDDKQRERIRKLLNAWRHTLIQKTDHTVAQLQDEVTLLPDVIDRAAQESEFNLELKARDRERKLVNKIDATLAKIEASDFGYCEICDNEIGFKRLMARPIATQCISCKTFSETKEKRKQGASHY